MGAVKECQINFIHSVMPDLGHGQLYALEVTYICAMRRELPYSPYVRPHRHGITIAFLIRAKLCLK